MANISDGSNPGQFRAQEIGRTGNLSSLASNFFSQTQAQDWAVDLRTREGKQMGRVYSDSLTDADSGYLGAGTYYSPQSYSISQTATDEVLSSSQGDSSAFIEMDVPTSTTDYSRPRTVAAGYDPSRQVMTVVFRDGTFYNYYEVSQSEWDAFHASYSKGKPWLNRANKNQGSDGLFIGKPRGDAGDMKDVPPAIREALYRVIRTYQQRNPVKVGRTKQSVQMYPKIQSGPNAGKTRKYGKMSVPNAAKQSKSASQIHKPHTGKRNAS
jgi:hypothetical protein